MIHQGWSVLPHERHFVSYRVTQLGQTRQSTSIGYPQIEQATGSSAGPSAGAASAAMVASGSMSNPLSSSAARGGS